LREMYDEKLRDLTYGDVKQIDDFLEAASEVFRIFVDISPNDLAERRALHKASVIETPSGLPVRMKTGSALPFDEAPDGVSSVCEAIRLVCRPKDEASTSKPQKGTDRVQAVEAHEHGRRHQPSEAASGRFCGSSGPAVQSKATYRKEWCARFKAEQLIKVHGLRGQALGRGRRNPFFRIVALKETTDRDGVLSRLEKANIRA
ncbi:hypothetical protein FOZ62_013799, partial [Perkinsus olseni]